MAFDTYLKICSPVNGEATAGQARAVDRDLLVLLGCLESHHGRLRRDGPLGRQGLGLELQRHEEDRGLVRHALRRLLRRPALRHGHGRHAQGHRRRAGHSRSFLKYTFTDVMVESIQWSGSTGGDDTPTESRQPGLRQGRDRVLQAGRRRPAACPRPATPVGTSPRSRSKPSTTLDRKPAAERSPPGDLLPAGRRCAGCSIPRRSEAMADGLVEHRFRDLAGDLTLVPEITP